MHLLGEALYEGEVLLPQYICDSVLKCFVGKKIRYYKLKRNLEVDIDDLKNKLNCRTSAVYLMHYFGSVQHQEICSLLLEKKEKYHFTIIEDTTHSIFSRARTVGDYCVCSLRKWFAIPDGAVLYSSRPIDQFNDKIVFQNKGIKKIYGMILKTLYLDKAIESNTLYREIFESSETLLDKSIEIMFMSEISTLLLQCYDVEEMVDIRRVNYQKLQRGLASQGLSTICPLEFDNCPMTFPLRVFNRDDFRSYLTDNKIYCPIHWPLQNTELYNIKEARILSEQIISLPIDQRYGSNEMEYIINVILKYDRKLS